MKYFIALLLCVILVSCESITNDRDHGIKGFWKYTLSNPTTGAVDSNNQFIEIKDSTFYFWHENIDYLPPLRYWVQGDSIDVKSLSPAVMKGYWTFDKTEY